jgi:hypothetical protein
LGRWQIPATHAHARCGFGERHNFVIRRRKAWQVQPMCGSRHSARPFRRREEILMAHQPDCAAVAARSCDEKKSDRAHDVRVSDVREFNVLAARAWRPLPECG